MRCSRSIDLYGVLDGLEQRDRIRAFRDLAAGILHDPRQRIGGGGLVQSNGLSGGAECGQLGCEIVRRADVGELFQPMVDFEPTIAGADESAEPLRAGEG